MTSLHSRARESGNIMIYVLGAIFLMGILISVVRGSGESGASIDAERMLVLASEVQQYGNELEQAVTNIIRQGFSESQIAFAPPGGPGPGSIADEPRRQVFARDGGAASVRNPPPSVVPAGAQWTFTSDLMVDGVGTTCTVPGPSCADLLAVLPVKKVFCLQLNISASVPNPSGAPPVSVATLNAVPAYSTGSFTGGVLLEDGDNALLGKREGCFQGDTNDYFYYRVLLAR